METHDDIEPTDERKLIPEWSVKADDQIIFFAIGVVVFLALLGYGCTQFGGDDNPLSDTVEQVVPGNVDLTDVEREFDIDAAYRNGTATLTGVVANEDIRRAAGRDALAVPGVTSVRNNLTIAGDEAAETTTTEAPATTAAPTTTAAPATTAPTTTVAAPADLTPDVAAAVGSFAGVQGLANGSTAVLEGVVGTAQESADAEANALAVDGITDVDNRLRILQPEVVAALDAEGVANGGASMNGTIATVTGLVDTEEQRAAALAAAAAVPGVTEVIDQLETAAPAEDVVGEINALFEANPIQFASGSDEILAVSFPILDEAADLLARAPQGTNVTVEGYTDTQGPADSNLELSQGRADAVRAYLVDKGINADSLTAEGRGETTEFGSDLASNRRVQLSL